MGTYYLQKENYEQAGKYLEQAYQIAEETKIEELKWFIYKSIIPYYKATNQKSKLIEVLLKNDELKDKIYQNNSQQKIAYLEKAYALENKRLESEKLMEKSARLASIGVMAAGITHEINQPLNSIAVNADGLLYMNETDNILSDFYIDAIQQIYDASQRISEIVNHMRQFWSTDDYLEKQVFDVKTAIRRALQLVDKQMNAHGVEIRKNFATGEQRIIGNIIHLEQVIINLITNSIQAMTNDNIEPKTISIATCTHNDQVLLTLMDSGLGVKEAYIEKLFDPFFSTKDKDKNMGLGLAIVEQFVKSMNGSIHYITNDTGAKFEIKFPLHIEE